MKRLAIAGGGALGSEVYLTPTEDGALLLSGSRSHPSRYRIAKLSVTGQVAHAIGRLQASGTLAAPPFLTRRALSIGVAGPGNTLQVRELPVSALAPPHGGPLLWPLQ
ncbi:MAG: hypothetical protein KF718_32825 [Polyangiaceae bacterium]|nr:hypothetical protein [Polyangiaceae bacterium]